MIGSELRPGSATANAAVSDVDPATRAGRSHQPVRLDTGLETRACPQLEDGPYLGRLAMGYVAAASADNDDCRMLAR